MFFEQRQRKAVIESEKLTNLKVKVIDETIIVALSYALYVLLQIDLDLYRINAPKTPC